MLGRKQSLLCSPHSNGNNKFERHASSIKLHTHGQHRSTSTIKNIIY